MTADPVQASARRTALYAALGLIQHEHRNGRSAVSVGGDQLPWLKQELEHRGFDVDDRPSPTSDDPTLWVTW